MIIDLQIPLANDIVLLLPLNEEDFEAVYAAASDPAVWEQHPNKDRWKREVFQTFFKGAMESHGAYKIMDKSTGKVIGSTRYYDYKPEESCILIGYTFFAKEYWGTGFNHAVKRLMIDYIFQFVSTVILHIGSTNYRSQKSIEKLGAKKIDELEVTYFGEMPKQNFVYEIKKEDWVKGTA